METVKINRKEYQVKTQWSEVTLNEFISFEPTELLFNVMLCTNIPLDVFRNLKANDLTKLIKLTLFLKEPPEHTLKNKVEINGETLQFITDIGSQPLARWIAIEAMVFKKQAIIDSVNNGETDYIPHVLSLMVQEPDGSFNQNKLMEYHKLILDMSVSDALGLYVFFLKLFEISGKNLKIYTNEILRLLKSKRISQKNGIGSVS